MATKPPTSWYIYQRVLGEFSVEHWSLDDLEASEAWKPRRVAVRTSGKQKGQQCSIESFMFLQGGAPPSYKWVIIPLAIDISPINHIVIGLINQLNANDLGHHLVPFNTLM